MKLEKILETLTAYVNTLPEAEAEAVRTIAATRRKVSPRYAVGPAALGNLLVDLREGGNFRRRQGCGPVLCPVRLQAHPQGGRPDRQARL